MNGRRVRCLLLFGLSLGLRAADQKTSALSQLSGALEQLAATVAPAVVQVQVSAWCGPVEAPPASTARR